LVRVHAAAPGLGGGIDRDGDGELVDFEGEGLVSIAGASIPAVVA